VEVPRLIPQPAAPAKLGQLVVWVAVVTAIVTAVVVEATWGDQVSARVLAVAVGILVGAAISLVSWWVLTAARSEHAERPVEAPPVGAPPVEAPTIATPVVRAPAAEPAATRSVLEPELEKGAALRAAEPSDDERDAWAADVDRWVEETGRRIEEHAPQFAGYFATASSKAADPAARLDRHLARLRTIVHDSL